LELRLLCSSCLQFLAFWPFKRPKRRRFIIGNIKKNWPGLTRVWPGGTGPGSTGFSRANSQAGFCLHPDRSQARVGRVPGRPAGPVQVLKHWIEGHYAMFLNSKLNNFTSTLQKSNNTQWLAEKMCFFHCILKVFLKKLKFLF